MLLDNVVKQMSQEEIVNLANELTDAVEKNKFNMLCETGKLKYAHLIAMFLATQAMDDGRKLYLYFYKLAMKCGKDRIISKVNNGNKIKIAFLPISASEWQAEYIYRKLENDNRFEVEIVPVPLIGRSKEDRTAIYLQTCRFFGSDKYNVKEIYDTETEEIKGWDEIGGIPDIIVHLTPWYLNIAPSYQITKLPLNVVNIYISYSLSIGNSKTEEWESYRYNQDFLNVMWKIYTETHKDYEGFKKYETLCAANVVNSGYIKMDYFYDNHSYTDEQLMSLWSVPKGADIYNYKKILITPHFSIGNTNALSFSTFDKNMYFFIYLAKKYEGKVSFIFKPHPNLRNSLIINGYMKSVDDYEKYLDEFRKLPNASVQEEGDYLTLFDTSDAIINDSISFIGEYMYVNKPMLFLKRPEQKFNTLGKEVIKAHYSAEGTDYAAIDEFVENVVIGENDYNKHIREDIFTKELDYYTLNGIKASEYVYKDITSSLF